MAGGVEFSIGRPGAGYHQIQIQLAKVKNTLNVYDKDGIVIIGRIVMDKEVSSTAMFYPVPAVEYYGFQVMEEIIQYMRLINMVGVVSITFNKNKDA